MDNSSDKFRNYRDKAGRVNDKVKIISFDSQCRRTVIVECRKCGRQFKSDKYSILKGHGCNICARHNRHQKQCMSHDEFCRRVKEILPDLIICSQYYNANSRVDVLCRICGTIYSSLASNLLSGYGCKTCYLNSCKSRSREEFQKCVNEKTDTIIVGHDYVNGKSKCTFTCTVCGYERRVIANLFLSKGCTCPCCDGNTPMKPGDYREFVAEKNPNLVVIGEYSRMISEIEYHCSSCGASWVEQPFVLYSRGYRCKYCECKNSRMEYDIQSYLIKHNIRCEPQRSFDGLIGVGGRKLLFDFYLPDYNLLIEAQGQQHYEPIDYFGGEEEYKKRVVHDNRKREYAKKNGFELLEISYKHKNDINSILDNVLCPHT